MEDAAALVIDLSAGEGDAWPLALTLATLEGLGGLTAYGDPQASSARRPKARAPHIPPEGAVRPAQR